MTNHTPEALLLSLAEQQAHLTRKLDQALSLHGISFSEFRTLQQLQNAPQQCMRRVDLAQRIGLTASGVTRLLNPMEKIGLVVKQASERDARVSLVKLTDGGQRLIVQAELSFKQVADETLQALNEQERGQFVRLIGKLR